MKTYSSAKIKGVEGRRTPAEVDAFFIRLSTPKHIKGSFTLKFFSIFFGQIFDIMLSFLNLSLLLGKVSKEKKIGTCVQQSR